MPRATTGLSYLTFALVVLGSLIFTVFVTLPQWSAYRGAQELLRKTEEKREERAQFLASIDARKQELDQYTRDVVALSVAFPDRFSPADLFATLQGLATSSGAVVLDIGEPQLVKERPAAAQVQPAVDAPAEGTTSAGAPPPAQPVTTLKSWETRVRVRGSYPQLRTFVRDLESTLVLSDLQSVDIVTSAQAATGTGGQQTSAVPSDVLQADLVIRTYVQSYSQR